MTLRKDAVAGQFYPASSQEIETMIKHYNTILDDNLTESSLLKLQPRAIIVPHAGYVYSAFTANFAFRLLANAQAKRVVVIGPSHKIYLKGTSISEYDAYETPFGNLPINTPLVNDLKERFSLSFIPEAHHEHSTEVQMPFIKKYDPNASVVELVYGDEDPERLAKLINYLMEDQESVVVISTDLSHYYDIEKAKNLDSKCMEAVANLDPDKLHQGCEACGKIGVQALLLAAKQQELKPIILDYRTSADASGDTSQVVGYMSAAFIS